jgi:branched-subunit amino acid aminotransferase/4-amino-4-deoxychorismate lyase
MSVHWRNGRIGESRPGEAAGSAVWGVFTTAGCDQGRPLLWSLHKRRLAASLASLGAGNAAVLPTENELCELLNAAGLDGPARMRVVAQRSETSLWNIEASTTSNESNGGPQRHLSPATRPWRGWRGTWLANALNNGDATMPC